MAEKLEFVCKGCGEKFYKTRRQVARRGKTYCSHECFTKSTSTSVELACANCGTPVKRTPSQLAKSVSGRAFCGRACSTAYNNRRYKQGKDHPNYVNGNSVQYRKKALDHYGEECSNSDCPIGFHGIDIPVYMLDVHHIDGDRANNSLKNLEVLCVWCHTRHTREELLGMV